MTEKINPITDLKSNLKPVQKKVLESGLIDKAMAELMEKWGNLPPGSAELVNENALKDATQETLTKLADDLATEVEKEHVLRETYLDLERIRWPATVTVLRPPSQAEAAAADSQGLQVTAKVVVPNLDAVMDRMGRYYFRIQDVVEDWFIPGLVLSRNVPSQRNPHALEIRFETILQKQVLYSGEQKVCLQVTTEPQPQPKES
jgi:hypothetical protein